MTTLEQLDTRVELLDSKVEQLDAKFVQLDTKFGKLDTKFEQLDRKFGQLDAKLEHLDARFGQLDAKFDLMYTMQKQFMQEIKDVKYRVIKSETSLDELTESHHALEDAEAKDAAATINHEKRITHLEKLANIEAIPAKHLKKFAS